MAIFSKPCKSDNFELQSSRKLSFMDVPGLRLNFLDCESFLASNCPDVLALCETNQDDSIDSGNFSIRGYQKGFQYSYAWSCSQGRTSFCTGLICRKLCRFSDSGFTSLSVSLFFLYQLPSSSLCKVFDSVSSNIDEALSINSSANVIVFGGFNIHHKDWLIYSGETEIW